MKNDVLIGSTEARLNERRCIIDMCLRIDASTRNAACAGVLVPGTEIVSFITYDKTTYLQLLLNR